jgi:hypothetical protein
VHRAEDHSVRELVFDRFREIDGFGDVVVGGDGIMSLDFEMRGVPKLGLVVQVDECRIGGIRPEDAGQFLI